MISPVPISHTMDAWVLKSSSDKPGMCLKAALELFILGLLFSCQSLPSELNIVHQNSLECHSQLPYLETKKLMEQLATLQARLYDLLEISPPQHLPFKIHIFDDKKTYMDIAANFGVPGKYADGFCDTDRLELYAWLKPSITGYKNISTLFHEFTHLVLSEKIIYPENPRPGKRLPFWVTEGLATYVETAFFEDSGLVFRPEKSQRFKQLLACLPMDDGWTREIINRDYAHGVSLDDYAKAWGITTYIFSSPLLQAGMVHYMQTFPEQPDQLPFKDFEDFFLEQHTDLMIWEEAVLSYLQYLKSI